MEAAVAQRKPSWIRSAIPSGKTTAFVGNTLQSALLNTVCEEARCPNMAKCWECGTATFMLMGSVCTRNCLFCSVESGKPKALDASEPKKIAKAVKEMKLRYAVLTSVDRDDLADCGAGHFAKCISEVKRTGAKVEALVPDFQGRPDCLEKIAAAKPVVLGHNIEVVERLQQKARDAKASYAQSLELLHKIKALDSGILTKSSLMLGLGESFGEVLKAMDDLLAAECDFLTLGQYLQPCKKALPVFEYVKPEVFAELREIALEKGFKDVAAGPLVRSSYRAGELFEGKGNL